VALANLSGLPSPLNAMQILWINIIMDGPPAQSLGVEPVDPAVVRRPPRPRSEHIVTAALLRRVLLSAAIITAGTFAVYLSERRHAGLAAEELSHAAHTRRDTTMTFTTFVAFDMFNALACRSSDRSLLALPRNPFFLAAVGGSCLGQLAVVYAPPLQAVFQTEALGLADWALILAVACTVLLADEAVKAVMRAREGGEGGGVGAPWPSAPAGDVAAAVGAEAPSPTERSSYALIARSMRGFAVRAPRPIRRVLAWVDRHLAGSGEGRAGTYEVVGDGADYKRSDDVGFLAGRLPASPDVEDPAPSAASRGV